jgi:hypothetical protein
MPESITAAPRKKLVTFDRNLRFYDFDTGGATTGHAIRRSGCDTMPELLRHIRKLCEYPWCTTGHIADLIDLCEMQGRG